MSEFWKGIALPWGDTIPSVIEPKSDKEVLKSSVLWIVLTALGERVMQPEFGSLLPSALFEQNDITLAEGIKSSVRNAIARWDDRIKFVDFVITTENNNMTCSLQYKMNADPIHDSIDVVEFQITPEMLSS